MSSIPNDIVRQSVTERRHETPTAEQRSTRRHDGSERQMAWKSAMEQAQCLSWFQNASSHSGNMSEEHPDTKSTALEEGELFGTRREALVVSAGAPDALFIEGVGADRQSVSTESEGARAQLGRQSAADGCRCREAGRETSNGSVDSRRVRMDDSSTPGVFVIPHRLSPEEIRVELGNPCVDRSRTENIGPNFGLAVGAATDVSQKDPLRVHAEWSEQGLRLWLGMENDQSDPATQRIQPLLHQLQRWLARYGLRLLSLVCNGRTVWDEDRATGAPDSLFLSNQKDLP